MHKELDAALEEIRKARDFNTEKWTEDKCKMLNEYMRKCGLRACVVNVSGGVDSGCTLGMCVMASKMEGSPIEKVIGICQPIHSTDTIWKRGLEVVDAFRGQGVNVEGITIDGSEIFNQLSGMVEGALGGVSMKAQSEEKAIFAKGQLKSYLRTPPAYFAAQVISSSGLPCVVMGTGNKDEDGYLLYFCKAGDGVCDIQIINDIHKNEVFKVAKYVGVPQSVLDAPPSADLWEGQTDEKELGFSYDFIELFTTTLSWEEEKRSAFTGGLSPDALAEYKESGAKAEKVHNANKHKLESPVNLNLL